MQEGPESWGDVWKTATSLSGGFWLSVTEKPSRHSFSAEGLGTPQTEARSEVGPSAWQHRRLCVYTLPSSVSTVRRGLDGSWCHTRGTASSL